MIIEFITNNPWWSLAIFLFILTAIKETVIKVLENREGKLELLQQIAKLESKLMFAEREIDSLKFFKRQAQTGAGGTAGGQGGAYTFAEQTRKSLKEIKAEYRDKVKKMHPDIVRGNGGSEAEILQATKDFQELTKQYERDKRRYT